jgi:hypothetical protein
MRISAVASSISSGSAMAGLVSGGARLGRGDLSCGLGKRRRGSREEMRETETVKVSNFALIHMVTINRKSSAGFVARRDECAESDSGEWGVGVGVRGGEGDGSRVRMVRVGKTVN